ncbi:hypothetical protein F2Q70_00026245 [Brassica cretica]|uniref:Uncharacterized protein n=1 Tax=Brassica cretica TaxID=69181 RepID=A0A8S9LAQ3_BRACR|nr:hypothetical protein F2Q70_00026245 [Brassica cretica]
MYMSKASHLAVPKHQRTPIWTEEAAGFHKRVKRIHDPRKIVVPCTVFEAESPIPPDRSMQISSYIEGWRYHHAIRQVWGKKRRNWKKRKRIRDGLQSITSIDRSPLNCVAARGGDTRIEAERIDETARGEATRREAERSGEVARSREAERGGEKRRGGERRRDAERGGEKRRGGDKWREVERSGEAERRRG